jgi:hypothetical protein
MRKLRGREPKKRVVHGPNPCIHCISLPSVEDPLSKFPPGPPKTPAGIKSRPTKAPQRPQDPPCYPKGIWGGGLGVAAYASTFPRGTQDLSLSLPLKAAKFCSNVIFLMHLVQRYKKTSRQHNFFSTIPN